MKHIGVDVFLNCDGLPVKREPKIKTLAGFQLKGISNRGTRVWPGEPPNISMTDVYCCRFTKGDWAEITQSDAVALLVAIGELGFEWVHVEKLFELNGAHAFSVMQGD